MTKMKKLASVLLAVVMAAGLMVPAFADTNNDGFLLGNNEFVASADVTKTELEGGAVQYEFVRDEAVAPNDMQQRNGTIQERKKSVAAVIVFDEETENMVDERIATIKNSLQGISVTATPENPSSGWLFGDSLYMEIETFYTSTIIKNQTCCKITKVVTRTEVNSGTILNTAVLNVYALGVTPGTGTVNKEYEKNIKGLGNPYTCTEPNNWPYISNSGPMLGAKLTCTARRSSGEVAGPFTVSDPVFVN